MVIQNNILQKIQKNRFCKNSKRFKIKFGDFAMCCKNDGRIELLHITIIKKKIKNFIKKSNNNVDVTREKIWYFGRFNFLIQKKSKNSRMGKGKGLVERKCMRVRKNFILFEFKGVSFLKLFKLIKYLNKIFSVKFYIFKKYDKNYNLWSSKKRYIYFYEKYLY